MTIVAVVSIVIAIGALVCRARAFAERDECRRMAREWKAVAAASEEMRAEQCERLNEILGDLSDADDGSAHWQDRCAMLETERKRMFSHAEGG